MTNKILDDVYEFLGASYMDGPNGRESTLSGFAPQIKMYVNDSLQTLIQNGVGKPVDVKDDTTWDDFFGDAKGGRSNAIMYVLLAVNLLFDPPLPSQITLMKERRDECLWRSRTEFDL